MLDIARKAARARMAACCCLVLAWGLPSQAAQAQPAKAESTRIVILGVTHSGQLVDEAQGPGMMRAYFERVRPDAIAVERDPQSFARNDFYEFTYEAQSIAVPWAREHRLPVYPVDWLPPTEDQRLMFGIDVESPPPIRAAGGLGAFMSFDDPGDLARPLLYADAPGAANDDLAWADTPADPMVADGARRLFLYRTFLQGRRIVRAAAAHRGGVLLVVVGSQHKPDLERMLRTFPQVELVGAASFGTPAAPEAARLELDSDAHAVATFNLLGVQSASANVPFPYVGRMVERVERTAPGAEARLLRTRLDVLQGKLPPSAAAAAYRDIAAMAGDKEQFAWNGVKDRSRIDSYFDPFGNLTVGQRAQLEQARELYKNGDAAGAGVIRDKLAGSLGQPKGGQLLAYWETYVSKAK